MKGTPLVLVAAVARDGTIGKDGGLPWRIRSDLAAFRRTTMGKPVVMGRRTWESLPRKPLDGRANIVVTRQEDFAGAGAIVAWSMDEAFRLAEEEAAKASANAVCVIGGSDLFRGTIDRAARLVIAHVDLAPAGDVFFPPIDPAVWRETSRERLPQTAGDTATADLTVYERR